MERLHTTVKIPTAQVQGSKDKMGRLARNIRSHHQLAHGQSQGSQPLQLVILLFDRVAIGSALARLVGNQRADRMGRHHLLKTDMIIQNQLSINLRPVAKFRHVARGRRQLGHKIRLQIHAGHFGRQLDRPTGIAQNLHPFRARDFLKKPAATGEHQQGMALHFQQPQGIDSLLG